MGRMHQSSVASPSWVEPERLSWLHPIATMLLGWFNSLDMSKYDGNKSMTELFSSSGIELSWVRDFVHSATWDDRLHCVIMYCLMSETLPRASTAVFGSGSTLRSTFARSVYLLDWIDVKDRPDICSIPAVMEQIIHHEAPTDPEFITILCNQPKFRLQVAYAVRRRRLVVDPLATHGADFYLYRTYRQLLIHTTHTSQPTPEIQPPIDRTLLLRLMKKQLVTSVNQLIGGEYYITALVHQGGECVNVDTVILMGAPGRNRSRSNHTTVLCKCRMLTLGRSSAAPTHVVMLSPVAIGVAINMTSTSTMATITMRYTPQLKRMLAQYMCEHPETSWNLITELGTCVGLSQAQMQGIGLSQSSQ